MKVKGLLKFYFSADSLERAFDEVIYSKACSSGTKVLDGELCAESILELIEEKRELSRLWNYIDGVFSKMTRQDGERLKRYAVANCGADEAERKKIRCSAMKFRRRAHRIHDFAAGVALAEKYGCLLR